jgi:hypothetical protein
LLGLGRAGAQVFRFRVLAFAAIFRPSAPLIIHWPELGSLGQRRPQSFAAPLLASSGVGVRLRGSGGTKDLRENHRSSKRIKLPSSYQLFGKIHAIVSLHLTRRTTPIALRFLDSTPFMRRDFQIAIISLLATIPIGAWMAVAPEYLHLKGTALAGTYWRGMSAAAILIILAALVALRAEAQRSPKGHKERMIGIIGMGACGFGFFAFLTLFLVHRPAENEAENHIPNASGCHPLRPHHPCGVQPLKITRIFSGIR